MEYPYTGFGDPADLMTDFSPFTILRGDRGEYGDWEADQLMATHQIATTNTYVEQFLGYGPALLTLTLYFPDRAGYLALRARSGTVGTLVLRADFTSHSGTKRVVGRDTYEHLPNTTMLAPAGVTFNVDGSVTCTVTFRRQEVL